MCVCLKDWLDAESRSQDSTYAQNDNIDGSDRSGSTSTSSRSIQLDDELEGKEEDEEDQE